MDRELLIVAAFSELMSTVRADNDRWWRDLDTGEPLNRNMGEMLMLVVSEVAEAMEGHRKDLMDDHLPHRKMFEVELADVIIRIMDIAAHNQLNLADAVLEKLDYNRYRQDHTNEARKQDGGKKY